MVPDNVLENTLVVVEINFTRFLNYLNGVSDSSYLPSAMRCVPYVCGRMFLAFGSHVDAPRHDLMHCGAAMRSLGRSCTFPATNDNNKASEQHSFCSFGVNKKCSMCARAPSIAFYYVCDRRGDDVDDGDADATLMTLEKRNRTTSPDYYLSSASMWRCGSFSEHKMLPTRS